MKIPAKIKNKIKDHAAGKVSIILLLLVLFIACEKENDLPEYNPPADHTVNEDGFMHKSRLHQPLANCVSCHGSDLKGGTTGVSCYECHGQKW
jgi:cytochrome c553